MITINTKLAVDILSAGMPALGSDAIKRAVSKAINRQMTPSKNLAIKDITRVYAIDPDYLKDKTRLVLKYSRTNTLTATIQLSVRPIGLTNFPVKQTEKGVEIEIKKGKIVTLKHAFLNLNMPKGGGRGVFGRGAYRGGKFDFRNKRVNKATSYQKVNGRMQPIQNDLEINNLKTVSAYTSFVRPALLQALDKRINTQFPKRLVIELQKEMKGVTG